MDYFPRSQAVLGNGVIARQAELGMGKAPSGAWVASGFPSATWEPEDKNLGGTGILPVWQTG
jgi:hypothetical protein